MNWFKRKTIPDPKSIDDHAAPGKSGYGAMHYFAIFSRIFTPLAILGWLCWMPSPNRTLPKNWDPGCPELKGTWVECELDPSKSTQVISMLWPLDAERILQIERCMDSSTPGGWIKIETRIAILDARNGDRLRETAWQPGYTSYWPRLGLMSNYFDTTSRQFRLIRWKADTLTEQQVLMLPENHWEREFGLKVNSEAHFRPRSPAGWQMLCSQTDQHGMRRLSLQGILLDEQGALERIDWQSDPTEMLSLIPEYEGGPFSARHMRNSGLFRDVPLDPVTGWPDVSQLREPAGSPVWVHAPRFGHIEVRKSENWASIEDANSPLRSLVTAPLAVTDHPFPNSGIRLQASFLLGQLRTLVWRQLYKREQLQAGFCGTLALAEVRLFDPERGINCAIDGETMRALQAQAKKVWRNQDADNPEGDPRLRLMDGADLILPLHCLALPNDRLLVLHFIDDAPDSDAPAVGRLRLGVVEKNQLTWLGWFEDRADRLNVFFATSNTHLHREGDKLVLLRDGVRSNGSNHPYSIPSAWISLPLPSELSDLPEGPLP